MSYADSLRQQAKWIDEAVNGTVPEGQRIDLGDVDTDELRSAADEIEGLRTAAQKVVDEYPVASGKVTTVDNPDGYGSIGALRRALEKR